MELKPRGFFSEYLPWNKTAISFQVTLSSGAPQWAATLHWVTAPHLPLPFFLHRSIGQVFHGHNGAVGALEKATPGSLCCRATVKASPQGWVPTTQSWNWELQSHQLLWWSSQMKCWKQVIEKHSHVKAKLGCYTNLNKKICGFGLLWNSMRTQILGTLASFHRRLPFRCLGPQQQLEHLSCSK